MKNKEFFEWGNEVWGMKNYEERRTSVSVKKCEKTGKKVVHLAEKQYLCGRKAVIAFAHGPRRSLPEQELCIL